MVEELLHARLEVGAVGRLYGPVRFAPVVEQPGRFAEAAQGGKPLDALVPGHGPVVVVVQDQERGVDLVGREDGAVLVVTLEVAPGRAPDAALGVLVLKLTAAPAAPAYTAVGREHIHHRRAGLHGGEQVGLGDHVGRLVATPAVALHADALLIDEALVQEVKYAAHHAIVSTLAGVANAVVNVGVEDHVALADVVAVVDAAPPRQRRTVAKNAVAAPLVEIHEQGVFLRGVEVVRLHQHTAQGAALGVGPGVEFVGAPGEVRLPRVGVGYLVCFPCGRRCVAEVGELAEIGAAEDKSFAGAAAHEITESVRAF